MPNDREVFVIHGRDDEARKAIWRFLTALDLRPLDWEAIVRKTGRATPFLGDVLTHAFTDNQAAVVLLTPDDVANLHPKLHAPGEPPSETTPTGQARPNVLFELGMAMALQPERTVVIEIGQLRPFSDFGGRNVIRFDGTVVSLQKIVQRLTVAGCAVDTTGTDWMDITGFVGLDAFTRRP